MIGTFTKGQHVSVYPHGTPEKAAEATVLIISGNQRSIAVTFDDKPPFAVVRGGGFTIVDATITLFAYREEHGPWVELMGGGHYEIEAL
jgi:hypothetical protein